MVQMIWQLCEIDAYIDDIKELFSKNVDHKHAQNYSKYPLFHYTAFGTFECAR